MAKKTDETVETVETVEAETVETEIKKEVDYTQLVKYTAVKDKYRRDDIPVSVNGKTWLIKRGVEVTIPLYVKLAIDNSEAQDLAAAEYIESKESKE